MGPGDAACHVSGRAPSNSAEGRPEGRADRRANRRASPIAPLHASPAPAGDGIGGWKGGRGWGIRTCRQGRPEKKIGKMAPDVGGGREPDQNDRLDKLSGTVPSVSRRIGQKPGKNWDDDTSIRVFDGEKVNYYLLSTNYQLLASKC